jgi:hypothetical protein
MITALLRRSSALILLAFIAIAPTRAESTGFGPEFPMLFVADWEGAKPFGDLNDKVTDELSLVGVAGEARLMVWKRFSLGAAVAWNRFTKGDDDVRVDAVSPRLTAHVHLSLSRVQPYVGVGAGAVYTNSRSRAVAPTETWGFCVDPQLGVLVTLVPELALDLHVRYEFTTVSLGTAHDLQWLSVGAGFAFY